MNCKNCQKPLKTVDNYCNNCGAKVIRNRLTIKNLLEDIYERFLNFDNTFLITYLTLFKNPENVIHGYINGVRKKFISVINYFGIAITLSGFLFFIILKAFPESLDITTLIPENSPQTSMNINWIYDYYSFIAFINLPIYALISKLVFRGFKKFNYTEHLVINTYIIAQYSLTSIIPLFVGIMLGANYYIIGNCFTVILIFYFAYCYKRIFPLTTEQIVLRTLLFLGILIGLIILSSILQLVALYFNGGLQEIIDTAKASEKTAYIASSFINWTS